MTTMPALLVLYGLTLLSLLVGTGAIYLALVRSFPVTWLYYHYFARKPLAWALLIGGGAFGSWAASQGWIAWTRALPAFFLLGLAVVLAHRLHQERAFPAVDFPPMADDASSQPIDDTREVAVIEHGGESKAYPLDFVIHHHIVNDRLGDRTVSLTYCAMCRSVMAFDVTELGPLFVGSFKHANMIVADRRTKTFFQQATFESIIGPLHPCSLDLVPCQVLPWADVRRLDPAPRVVAVTAADFRPFQLPIPGIWRRIVAGEATPGLPAAQRDRRFPARTRVVGILDPSFKQEVYLKEEILGHGLVVAADGRVVLVGRRGTVNGFHNELEGQAVSLQLSRDGTRLVDSNGARVWDLRGRPVTNTTRALVPVALSDEYWFSWRHFHPHAPLVRLAGSEEA